MLAVLRKSRFDNEHYLCKKEIFFYVNDVIYLIYACKTIAIMVLRIMQNYDTRLRKKMAFSFTIKIPKYIVSSNNSVRPFFILPASSCCCVRRH